MLSKFSPLALASGVRLGVVPTSPLLKFVALIERRENVSVAPLVLVDGYERGPDSIRGSSILLK